MNGIHVASSGVRSIEDSPDRRNNLDIDSSDYSQSNLFMRERQIKPDYLTMQRQKFQQEQ